MKEYTIEFCLSTSGCVIVSANDKNEAIRLVKNMDASSLADNCDDDYLEITARCGKPTLLGVGWIAL